MASMLVSTSRKWIVLNMMSSAHWCGPCRQFTPVLRKVYLSLKKAGQPFEVVFCSKDSDKKEFNEYYGTMPWLAVDYDNAELRESLAGLFDVSGIPRFVMLSPEGVINPNAKDDVMEDENGFPWAQPTIKDIVSSNVRGKNGALDASLLADKYVGLYFSAHWCGPCKAFTPVLIDTYKKLNEAGKNFEVVFCSLDNDQKQYEEYYGSMPWLTLGFENKAVTKLKNILGVEGIPCLVLCNTELEPVTADGVEAVKATGVDGFPWLPADVKDLNQEPDDINAKACLVFFMESASEDKKEAYINMLNEVAPSIRDAVSIFFVKESGDVSEQIRAMLQITDSPILTIVDIPDNGGFYVAPSEFSAESIVSFVQGFAAKSIERKQMVA